MITKEQFDNLKIGDILINPKANNAYHSVVKVYGRNENQIGFKFPLLSDRWNFDLDEEEALISPFELFSLPHPINSQEYMTLRDHDLLYDSELKEFVQVIEAPYIDVHIYKTNMVTVIPGKRIIDYTLSSDDFNLKIHSAFNVTICKPVKLFKII